MRSIAMSILSVLLLTTIVCTTHAAKSYLRIIGGRDSETEEYPYILRMEIDITVRRPGNTDLIKSKGLCTASAVTSTWSLTAAHCVVGHLSIVAREKNTNNPSKIAGYLRRGGVNNLEAERGWLVTSYIAHPNYRHSPNTLKRAMSNDIGLLRSDPLQLPSFARISSVDYKSLSGHEGIIAGYGLTNRVVNSKQIINDTKSMKLPLQVLKIMVKRCEGGDKRAVSPSVCLAPVCGASASACMGDSGGPLLHPSGVVAVASMANRLDCTKKILSDRRLRSNAIGIYTPVTPYLDWISSHIKK